MRSEWRTFSNDSGGDDPSRVGGPGNPFLEGSQLDTMIADNSSGKAKDLNKVQSRSAMRSDRVLVNAFREIGIHCDRITLPKIVADQARHFYKIADQGKLVRGKTNQGIIAACIYTACHVSGNVRSFKEICALTDVPKKEIGKCYKLLSNLIKENQQLRTTTSDVLIARPCSILGLGNNMQKLALAIVRKINELGLIQGKSPLTIAATGIYILVCQTMVDITSWLM